MYKLLIYFLYKNKQEKALPALEPQQNRQEIVFPEHLEQMWILGETAQQHALKAFSGDHKYSIQQYNYTNTTDLQKPELHCSNSA